MLKKTITYTDFNGKEATEDFYFHMSKPELIELEVSHRGGLEEHVAAIVAAEDGKEIMAIIQDLIFTAYGKKSPDGKRFIKNDKLREEFRSSQAYEVFFMSLVLDAGAAIEFIRGIMPADMADEEKLEQVEKDLKEGMADALGTKTPEKPKPFPKPDEPRKLSYAEIREMDQDEFRSGIASGKYVIDTGADELPS